MVVHPLYCPSRILSNPATPQCILVICCPDSIIFTDRYSKVPHSPLSLLLPPSPSPFFVHILRWLCVVNVCMGRKRDRGSGYVVVECVCSPILPFCYYFSSLFLSLFRFLSSPLLYILCVGRLSVLFYFIFLTFLSLVFMITCDQTTYRNKELMCMFVCCK